MTLIRRELVDKLEGPLVLGKRVRLRGFTGNVEIVWEIKDLHIGIGNTEVPWTVCEVPIMDDMLLGLISCPGTTVSST
ncbi:hypothetical protein KP79_PYT26052 [Mizuhopecten yessoensis]|uniref:Uncharacterized protein n=1 Tax=Mizuhopecten yessoensis TaxID=6573 RepID=A0A210PI50_MIZYE|nr:hypothetical protein KP79_PYT26052 [Mizuhopecten yessoensis]